MEGCLTSSVVDQLLDWFMPLFSNWGYLIVFVGVFLESIFLTGWIAPGTTVILIAGFFASQGDLNIWMIWVTSVVAALLGDNVGYFIGRFTGKRVMERYQERPKLPGGLERSQRYFARYGGINVLFGRMISGVDAFIPLTAGTSGMPHWKYMAYDVPAAMLWSGVFCALGYFFGESWQTIDKVISWLGWGALCLIVLVVAAILVFRHRAKKRGQAAEERQGVEAP
jgi:membrane protein DedA with SNARE-associated domain